jgi:NhaP-type Na+/H+ or K+/H+ antiporter
LISGYGFLAVFVTALTLRRSHRDHEFNRDMHDITEQVERLAMMALLILFGGALACGLLGSLGYVDVLAAIVIIVIVRPVAGWLSLVGFPAARSEKMTLAFFGIRGVGSFYYLAYGLNHADFGGAERLWGIVGLVVLLSILLHGLTVTPVMDILDRQYGHRPAQAKPRDDTGAAPQGSP